MNDLNKMLNGPEKQYRLANMIVSALYTTALSLIYFYWSKEVAAIMFVYFIFLNLGVVGLLAGKKINL
jgi:hypothetical protein